MKLRIEKAIYGGAGLARVPAEAEPPLAGKNGVYRRDAARRAGRSPHR